jgi:hypothetical protein
MRFVYPTFGASNYWFEYAAETRPHYVILDDDLGELSRGRLEDVVSGNVITADFTGDGLPDTVFCGLRPKTSWDDLKLVLLETSLDSNFKPVFTQKAEKYFDYGNSRAAAESVFIPVLAAGDFDGDGEAEVCANNQLFTYNGGPDFILLGGSLIEEERVSDDETYMEGDGSPFYDILMGDLNGDGKDDIVIFHAMLKNDKYNNGTVREKITIFSGKDRPLLYGESPAINFEISYRTYLRNQDLYPAFSGCLPNVDDDSFILKDTGERELLFTDPHVIAVLASPPYYEGINEGGDGGTSFGKSKSSGSASSGTFGFSVGASFDFEYEAPFGLATVEFEASLTESFGWTQSESRELSESWG